METAPLQTSRTMCFLCFLLGTETGASLSASEPNGQTRQTLKHTEVQNNHLALQRRPALRRNIQVNMPNVSGTPLIKP